MPQAPSTPIDAADPLPPTTADMSRPDSSALPADADPDAALQADPGAAAHALLGEAISQALRAQPQSAAEPSGPAAGLRQRLQGRLAASLAGEAGVLTRRLAGMPAQAVAAGVQARCLYLAPPTRAQRPGEPLRAWLIDLAPGAVLPPDALGDAAQAAAGHTQREWLLLSGALQADGLALQARDFHARPAGLASPPWRAPADGQGARLFYRECVLADAVGTLAAAAAQPVTVRDAQAGWPAFAPGIRRRVLWQHAGQAALLYRVDAGASVPQHHHGHDEECLMLQGELFLDDRLLRAGDYQLAPAGSGHRVTETDTGGVLYAHGDLELRFIG